MERDRYDSFFCCLNKKDENQRNMMFPLDNRQFITEYIN